MMIQVKEKVVDASLNPRLPGRYGQMTRAEFDAEVAQIEAGELPEGELLTDAQWSAMKRAARSERRRRERAVKPVEQKVARVRVTIPTDLLAAVDAEAASRDMPRAALIALAMRRLLKIRD